jgi:peptide/nickel transport system permease protein
VAERSAALDSIVEEMQPRRGPARLIRSLLKAKLALIGMVIIAVAAVTALSAPLLAPADPALVVVAERLLPPAWQTGGSTVHVLGTDGLGRDILSRLIFGARVSLLVGCVSVFLAGLIGVSLGLLAGYLGGWLDTVLMRIADIQMAFPFILLAITLMAVLGSSLGNIIFTLAITGWVQYARMVRGQVLSLREKEFVDAARCVGVPRLRIIWRHVLPNAISPIIVLASFGVSSAIIAEAGLSFLGLGVPLSVPSWGAMLSQARDVQSKAWWPAVFPGIAITATVFGINVVGDWLRDVLDPHLRIG